MIVRYSKEERKRFRTRLRQLAREGWEKAEIVDLMHSEGFRKPDGTKITEKFLVNQWWHLPRRPKVKGFRTFTRHTVTKRKYTRKNQQLELPLDAATPTFIPRTIPTEAPKKEKGLVEEIYSSNLSDTLKIKLLTAMVER